MGDEGEVVVVVVVFDVGFVSWGWLCMEGREER